MKNVRKMKTNVLTLVITMVVAVILAGSILMPIISDAQKTIGPQVTYTNEDNSSSGYHYGPVDSIHLVIDENGASINDTIIKRASNPIVLFESDNISVNLPNTGSTATMEAYYNNDTIGGDIYGGTLDLTAENGEITAVFGANTLTFTYTWLITITENGEYINHQVGGNIYYTDPTNMIICGGVYSTGENDTYYSWYNGIATDNGEYDISLNPNGTLVSGTTDVYQSSLPRIVIGDEDFTPFRMLIKEEVVGHERGAGYALLGAIPIMVIVAILMVAVGAIAYRRAD